MRSADLSAADRFMPLVYVELRKIAHSYLRRESCDHTLEPTALVHEAYLKLVHQEQRDWNGRTHFLAAGARAMRQILVDMARNKGRKKRWGGCIRVDLLDLERSVPARDKKSILALDEALHKLAGKDPRKAQIVELRFFGGLNVAEVAEQLGCSKRTVEQEWTYIRAWLHRELSNGRR
jgi:RNA polymerase sigma factor (TIGR02999 family)